MKSIGHDQSKGTMHDKLFEIDLSLNHISEEDISSLMDEVPLSTQCLWCYTDLTIESQFGTEFAVNSFSGSFLVKKRCEVPPMT